MRAVTADDLPWLGNDFPVWHLEMTSGKVARGCATAGGCGNCWKLQLVAFEARNMMENVLSILIGIFLHNSNKPKTQTERYVFYGLAS